MTDNELIEILDKRRQLLIAEADKFGQIADAIRSSGNLLNSLYKPLSQDKSTKPSTEKTTGKMPSIPSEKILRPMEEYNEKGKLDDKIAYALTIKKLALKEVIIQVIMQHSPEKDPAKLRNALGARLSYLLKQGYITARKQGRSYKYKLIKT